MFGQSTKKVQGPYRPAATPNASSTRGAPIRTNPASTVASSAATSQGDDSKVTRVSRKGSSVAIESNASRPAMPGAWQSYRRASTDSLRKDASTPTTPVSAARKGSATSSKSSTSTASSRNNSRRSSLADKTCPELSSADGCTKWGLQMTALKKDLFVRSVPAPPACKDYKAAPTCYLCGSPATTEIREGIPCRREGYPSTIPGHYTAFVPSRFE